MRPAPASMLCRRLWPALLAALVATLALAPDAFAGILTPENRGGSPNAGKIHLLYTVAFCIGVVIFLLVEGLLLYSLFKFRARRSSPPPAQVRGNTPLEVSWTLGAALILVVLATLTFIFLPGIKNPARSKANGLVAEQQSSGGGRAQVAEVNQAPPPGPANTHLQIHVNGQQFLWRYDYAPPNGSGLGQIFSYYDMHVPTNTTVVLSVTSSDVVHEWWIPQLGGGVDATPGYVNETWFRVSKAGVYEGACAELCGKNHADMRARVIAESPAQFRRWEAAQAANIRQAQAYIALARRIRGQNP